MKHSILDTGDIARLAAAAMQSMLGLSIEDAVRQATESLRRATATQLTAKQVADSVRPDAIMCFEDGTWHIMLRRYVKRKFGLSPEQYRAKWGLPDDYPFVAPQYAAARSKIAKKTGLGRRVQNG
ncbi:MAG: MucR family transcriptional regulator [Alphaproteobacteria bacterium]|nr:MucR family transcriptional regulator [Alphaproteobacteria bacterium]MCL2758196.1 MucR family transcriptional regulator [Alphaproteobacteria bacterium]